MKPASAAFRKPMASVREERPLCVGAVLVFPSTGNISGPGGSRKLDPKVVEVLLALAAAKGGMVSKETLMADVWPGVVVTDFAISRCIYQLRKNLRKAAAASDSPIETLPKRGYRLTWQVSPGIAEVSAGAEFASPRFASSAGIVVILAIAALLSWGAWNRLIEQPVRPAIAVMPLADLSPSGGLAYFGEGIATALRMELGESRDVDVIAQTSSSYFRGRQASVQEIGKALDADYLVEGSVERDGDALRITAALVDAQDGRQIWSKAFAGATNVSFTAQQGIAAAIASYLDVSLGHPRNRGGTTDFKALDAYLRGIGTDDPELAKMQADLALARDPDYADALILKASAIYLGLWHGNGAPEQAWAEAEPLLERAREIAGELSEAYVLIGGFAMWREDYPAAETALRRALEINPSNSYGYVHLSRLMENTGRLQEAVSLAERNVRLDPMNAFRHLQLANRRWTAGDYQGGRASFERALELDPLNYAAWRDYALRVSNLEGVDSGLRLVARLQRNPDFRAMFMGAQPKVSAAGVGLFALWFSFIEDLEHERQMLELESHLADSATLHREMGWLYVRLGQLDLARDEAWAAIAGMPREVIANHLVVTVALRSRQGLDRVVRHYREFWPGLLDSPTDVSGAPGGVIIDAALILGSTGKPDRARELLLAAFERDELQDDNRAVALAHLGDLDQALSVLERHYGQGGYFSYVPGDPFWAPLANEPRFQAIVREEAAKDARSRQLVGHLVAAGELILPGQSLRQRASGSGRF